MKTLSAIVLSLLLLVGCDSGVSGTPMPMSYESRQLLEHQMGAMDLQSRMFKIALSKQEPEAALQQMVQVWTKLFDSLGYSYGATLVDISTALQGSPEELDAYMEEAHWTLGFVYKSMEQLLVLATAKDIDLEDYMHPDAVQAMREIQAKLNK